jgi:type IV pilus assembly protein PilN
MTGFDVTSVNLAAQPFRRERAQNAVYAAVCLFLFCSLVVLTSLLLSERSKAARERQDIDAETARLQALRGKQAGYQSVLARPQNADVFSTSVFLNELIARRSVSWTRVFKDLGTVLPNDIRLQVIRLPQVPAQEASGVNHVQLDMVVGTERPLAVHELLRNLYQSPMFGAASVISQTPPNQNDPLYKYRVMVSYAQRL